MNQRPLCAGVSLQSAADASACQIGAEEAQMPLKSGAAIDTGHASLSSRPLMRVGNDRDNQCRTQNELAARAALAARAGHTLTDAEWGAARARLLEFVDILRAWDRKTTAPRLGKVVLCQREP